MPVRGNVADGVGGGVTVTVADPLQPIVALRVTDVVFTAVRLVDGDRTTVPV